MNTASERTFLYPNSERLHCFFLTMLCPFLATKPREVQVSLDNSDNLIVYAILRPKPALLFANKHRSTSRGRSTRKCVSIVPGIDANI